MFRGRGGRKRSERGKRTLRGGGGDGGDGGSREDGRNENGTPSSSPLPSPLPLPFRVGFSKERQAQKGERELLCVSLFRRLLSSFFAFFREGQVWQRALLDRQHRALAGHHTGVTTKRHSVGVSAPGNATGVEEGLEVHERHQRFADDPRGDVGALGEGQRVPLWRKCEKHRKNRKEK